MDRFDMLVAVAHRRLRLRRILIAVERHPELLEKDMAIPNFEGLVDAMDKLEFSLEEEAKKLHADIASLGDRGLAAIGKGQARMGAVKDRIARVEQFVNKLEGANGGDPLPSSSAPSSASASSAAPEQLTVNGVSTQV